MKYHSPLSHPRRRAAFTLVEMIGVLAILTIMAGVLTPNILRSIERAAVRAEGDNLHAMGREIGLYLRDNSVLPTPAAWNTQLAAYSSLNAADILTNRRRVARLYVPDPVAANQRVLLISGMRNGVALPTAAVVAGNFQAIWDTAEGSVPAAAGWGAWTAGAGGNIEFLVIERVGLASIYRTDLQTYPVTLNNNGAGSVSYRIIWANGATPLLVTMPAGSTTAIPLSLRPRDRLNLYSDGAGVTLNYSYVVSNSGKTFTFTTAWVAL